VQWNSRSRAPMLLLTLSLVKQESTPRNSLDRMLRQGLRSTPKLQVRVLLDPTATQGVAEA
jgi:hypothetical protein